MRLQRRRSGLLPYAETVKKMRNGPNAVIPSPARDLVLSATYKNEIPRRSLS